MYYNAVTICMQILITPNLISNYNGVVGRRRGLLRLLVIVCKFLQGNNERAALQLTFGKGANLTSCWRAVVVGCKENNGEPSRKSSKEDEGGG